MVGDATPVVRLVCVDITSLMCHHRYMPTTTPAYLAGHNLGTYMADLRATGDGSYDCRWDLADAAKISTEYFNEFKRGLDDGLAGVAAS